MIRILLIICSLKFFTLEVSKRGRAQQLFGVSADPALQPRLHRVMPLHAVVRLRQRVPSEASVMVAAFPRRSRHLLFSASSRHLTTVAHMGSGCRSEEHTSELQSLMRISYAVFCFNKK